MTTWTKEDFLETVREHIAEHGSIDAEDLSDLVDAILEEHIDNAGRKQALYHLTDDDQIMESGSYRGYLPYWVDETVRYNDPDKYEKEYRLEVIESIWVPEYIRDLQEQGKIVHHEGGTYEEDVTISTVLFEAGFSYDEVQEFKKETGIDVDDVCVYPHYELQLYWIDDSEDEDEENEEV
jgi:hypothetical protein